MFQSQTALKGFSALLADLARYENGERLSAWRRRDATEEAAAMSADIREGGELFAKRLDSLTAPLARIAKSFGDMSKRLEADARASEIQRRAEGRERLAQLSAQIDESIAGGALSTVEVARLEGDLHRVAVAIGAP